MAGGTRDAGRVGRGPRIHPLVPAVVAVVVCGVLIAVVAASGGDDGAAPVAATTTTSTTAPTTTVPTTTTTTLPDPVDPSGVVAPGLAEEPPTTYRVRYEVVENGLARSETWIVRRPFESLVTSERDGELQSGTSTSRTSLRTFLSDRDGWLEVQPELHRAAFDQRAAGAVGTMEALGIVEVLGEGTVAGRPCTRILTGAPTSAGTPTAPGTDDEETELCIDGAGLVLSEAWSIEGRPVVTRTATEIEVGLAVDEAIFDPTPEVDGAEDFAAAFTTVALPADQETLDDLVTVPRVPDGYVEVGAVFRGAIPGRGSSGSEVVRFYASGPDLLEVAEAFAGGPLELSGGAAVRIEVPRWDEVWLEPGFRTSALRARLSESTYVELRHHDPALLLEVLRTLDRLDE